MVSIIIPVIREHKVLECISSIYDNAGIPASEYEILAETDTNRIGCPRMVKALVDKAASDWILFLGDDCLMLPGCVRNALGHVSELPDAWGMIGLNDQLHYGNKLATHWMAHKNLLSLLGGEFFYTGYRHCFCDQELMARCKELGRYIWAEDAVIQHDHPMARGESITGTDYEWAYRTDNFYHDRRLFQRRLHNGWNS